ncbi:GNAT family N-acetyltransferase [Rufibacter radiotolerans]|uniref:GNAT family N-acetyltransferase n=1 Tax=Rufibacter radiotolerans TaxID=1379910 RepID=UPI0018CD49BF|nr:GNAT family N-acetyltransferase [Rufibacter radiotolerans]
MRQLSSSPATQTELLTDRLLLKPYGPGMAQEFWQLLDQNRSRLQSDFPDRTKAVQTLADAERRLRLLALQLRAGDLYSFGIWRQEEQDYIGDITLRRLARGKLFAEVGYYLSEEAEGQGYATEALKAMLRYAFQVLRMDCVNVRCAEGNDRSKRVAERCGFTYTRTYTPLVQEETGVPSRPINVYRLLRHDHQAAQLR